MKAWKKFEQWCDDHYVIAGTVCAVLAYLLFAGAAFL